MAETIKAAELASLSPDDGERLGRRIDPRHFAIVLAVVKHGTFSRAAEALGVGQPALSKSISLLERRLGAKLFKRGPRGSTLTAAGEIVARRAEGLETLIARVEEEIAASLHHSDGPLEIGATPSMMLGLVPRALAGALDRCPTLIVNITEDMDDALMPALQRGEIDVLVGPVGGLYRTSPAIHELVLAEEPLFVLLPPGHRLSDAGTLGLRELVDEAWVLPTRNGSFHRVIESLFIAAGVPWPRNVIGTNRLQIHEDLVLRRGRIAILTAVQLFGASTAMRPIPLAGAPHRALGVKWRGDIALPPTAAIFIESLKAVAADLNGKTRS